MLHSNRFVACPRGTGEDTHRVWEALYLGSVPVVLKSQLSPLYTNLPVIQLNSWNDLNFATLDQYRPQWHFSLARQYPKDRIPTIDELQTFRNLWNNSAAILDTWITTIRGVHASSIHVIT